MNGESELSILRGTYKRILYYTYFDARETENSTGSGTSGLPPIEIHSAHAAKCADRAGLAKSDAFPSREFP
jgi:hypothetical protein